MKLYLSSVGIPSEEALLALLSNKQRSVAIIPNAWDVYPSERKNEEISKTNDVFKKIGFNTSFIDLATSNRIPTENFLSDYSLLWVMGGNTFYLNELMHTSALSSLLRKSLDDGLVYGGESAGAAIAGSTLHGIELMDDPQKASRIIWDGLNLVDFGIIPHWGTDKYADSLEKCRKEMVMYTNVRTIGNSQAIVIEGKQLKAIES